jgi:hypothetical protein
VAESVRNCIDGWLDAFTVGACALSGEMRAIIACFAATANAIGANRGGSLRAFAGIKTLNTTIRLCIADGPGR